MLQLKKYGCEMPFCFKYSLFLSILIKQIDFLTGIIIKVRQSYTMKLLHFLKKTICFFDMFYSSEMLRYNHDRQYKTVTGGIISLIIVSLVFFGFASMIIDTFNKTAITSSLDIQKSNDPTFLNLISGPENNFMFGIQIIQMNLSSTINIATGPRYFDIFLRIINVQNGTIAHVEFLDMEQCTDAHWSMMPQIVERSHIYNYSNWLCPKLGQNLPLQGSYTSPNQYITNIQILPCRNSTDKQRLCMPQNQILQFFEKNPNHYFGLFYINPVINPTKTNYIDYYLQGNQYVIFSQSQGSQAWIYFSQYQIETDKSIWPFSQIYKESGVIVQEKAITHTFLYSQYTGYANFYFTRSYDTLIYRRNVQKISAILAYIGGLVGAIAALLFLIRSYTATSLQLRIAFGLFYAQSDKNEFENNSSNTKQYNTKNTKVLPPKINFLNFVLLKIYRILISLNFIKDWKNAKVLSDFQDEILHQLDIKLLLRRIIALQNCISYLFQKHQIKGLQNIKQIDMNKARLLRKQLVPQDKYPYSYNQQQNEVVSSDSVSSDNTHFRDRTNRKSGKINNLSFFSRNRVECPQSYLDNDRGLTFREFQDFSVINKGFPPFNHQSKKRNSLQNETLTDLRFLRMQIDKNETSLKIWRDLDRKLRQQIEETIDIPKIIKFHSAQEGVLPHLDAKIELQTDCKKEEVEEV